MNKTKFIKLNINITILTIFHLYTDLTQAAEYSATLIIDIVFNFILLVFLFISLLSVKFRFLLIIPYYADFFLFIINWVFTSLSNSSLNIDDGLIGVNNFYNYIRIFLILIKHMCSYVYKDEEFDT